MARCVACPDDSLCAGRVVCGDPPDCNDSACQKSEYPPPLSNAEFYCTEIIANAQYTIGTPGAGTLHILAAEPERIYILEGFQNGSAVHSDISIQIVSTTLIDRIIYTQPARDSYYALNRYLVVDAVGEPRNASDGAQMAHGKRIPKSAGGVLTIGTEIVE